LIGWITVRYDVTERAAEEALTLGLETGQPDALLFYGLWLMGIRWVQGRDVELTALIAQAAQDNPGVPGFQAFLAFNYAWLGELDLARSQFDQLAKDDFTFPSDDLWLMANTFVAEVAAVLGDRAAAAVLSERLEPYRELIAASAAACTGAVSHVLGCLAATLGRDDEAEQYLTDALVRHERLEAPFFRARTMLELARVIRAREPERAEALFEEALTLADTYGMASIRERVLVANPAKG
jgi:tetratricopeptide (TPR) repeat protein